MVKLSDYLDYLYREVIQARKQVDIQSVQLAKEYAKDEYLKYFRVPRFTMPSVKLEVPIKIDEIDSEIKYNFKMDKSSYLADVNDQIEKVNKERNLKIDTVDDRVLKDRRFDEIVKDLEKKDYRFVKRLDDSLHTIDFRKKEIRRGDALTPADTRGAIEEKALNEIMKNALKNQFTPVAAKLNNIFIDPDTTRQSDKEKILVIMNVELVEEGLRIVNLKDENGKEFEEIVFE